MRIDIDFFSFISIFIPVVVGLFCYRRVFTTSKILIVFLVTTAILEIIGTVACYFYWNNLFLFHLHTYIEFAAYSIILSRLIRSKVVKQIITALISAFILFSLVNSLFLEDITGFNSIQRHIEATLIIGYCLVYVFELKQYNDFSLSENPYLIFALALLLYFSGSLFLFIFSRSMFATGDDSDWVIHGYLNIFLNLIFAIVIGRSIVYPRKKGKNT